MLLAELDPAIQQFGGYALSAVLGGVLTKLIGFFDDRDKRRHETRLTILETEHKQCHEDRAKEAVQFTELKGEHDLLKKTVERMRKRAEKHHPHAEDDETGEHSLAKP